MQAVEAREGHHAHCALAAQQAKQIRTHNRRAGGKLRRDHRAPVGPVIPGEEVSGEAVGQREQQQRNSRYPGGFTRLLIGAVEECLGHMQHHHHDHHAGAPVVQAAHEPAARDFRQDVAQAVVRIAGGRRVIEGQQRASEGLHQKQEQRHTAENLVPAARCRYLLVEEIANRGL